MKLIRNPFSVIIASDAAGINWTLGLEGRIIVFIIGLFICIIYILRYARKEQNDQTKSLIYDQKEEIQMMFIQNTQNHTKNN